MSTLNHTPITDSKDPRITLADHTLAHQIALYTDSEMCMEDIAVFIANHTRAAICRAAGIAGNDLTGLEALVWHHRDGWEHGGMAETWKDYALETEKERDTLRDSRENALNALGMHPDSDGVVLADEIVRIRDEGRAHFHELTKLQEINFELQMSQRAYETLLAALEDKGESR